MPLQGLGHPGETVGTLPWGKINPCLLPEPKSRLHLLVSWAALPLAIRLGSRGPASFLKASGPVSAAGREGYRQLGTHTCFRQVLSSPWGQVERVHHQGGPGAPGAPLLCVLLEPGGVAPSDSSPTFPAPKGAPAFSRPKLCSSVRGLSPTIGDPTHRYSLPVAPPSQQGGHNIVHRRPCPRRLFPHARAIPAVGGRWPRGPAQCPLLQSTLAWGCDAARAGVGLLVPGFRDAPASSSERTQTAVPSASLIPLSYGGFPGRPHGCRDRVATSHSGSRAHGTLSWRPARVSCRTLGAAGMGSSAFPHGPARATLTWVRHENPGLHVPAPFLGPSTAPRGVLKSGVPTTLQATFPGTRRAGRRMF